MHFNVNDNPVLVAPRPVRLTAPQRSLRLLHIDDADSDDHRLASPRVSPRANLSSEALEEFLSILRPAIFPQSSPALRPRRNGAVTIKAKPKIDAALSKSDQNSSPPHDFDLVRQTPTCSPEPVSEHLAGNWDFFGPEIASRWHAQVLASPISRMQTRNPFPRYAAHDITLSSIQSSPTIASTPTSPAAIPLPAPSPDETLEVF